VKFILTTLLMVIALTGCDPTSGGACDQIGSQTTDSHGQLWTCAKNVQTGKGYWYKGKP